MAKKIIPFRRIKHALPERKFKVLIEDTRPRKGRLSADRFPMAVVSIFAVVAVGAYLAAGGWEYIPRHLYDPACNIKGNIATGDRQRIYHLPTDSYYGETRVSWLRGERWFCSEYEAVAAGWRRAYL